MSLKLDRESQELEQAYPGILARLESEPLDRLGREFKIPKNALFQARERLRRLRGNALSPHPLKSVMPPTPAAIAPIGAPPAPPQVLDSELQAGLERAYAGITNALARRDDVEVAVQYGISLTAVSRIRAVLGVYRSGASVAQDLHASPPPKALPARLVRAAD
jgi:hypothetical protein